MKISDRILNYHDAHIEGYACFLFVLSLNFPLFFVPLFIYLTLLRRWMRWMLFVCLSALIFVLFTFYVHGFKIDRVEGIAWILNVEETSYQDQVSVVYKGRKYYFYTTKDSYRFGDLIYVKGDIELSLERRIPHGFNQFNYDLSRGFHGRLKLDQVTIIQDSPLKLSLSSTLARYMDTFESREYLRAFLFGERNDSEYFQTYKNLGILFLFSVSGLHLYVLTSIVRYLMFHFNLKNATQQGVILGIYLLFLYLYKGHYGVFRLLLMQIFWLINQRYHLKYTRLDGIQIIFFAMLILNPHYLVHRGFLMLYLIMNGLVLFKPLYRGLSPFYERLTLSLIIQAILIPFQKSHHILMLILLPLFVFIVTGPAFLLALMVLFFPFFDPFYTQMMAHFFWMVERIQYMSQRFYLPALSAAGMFIYYSCFGMFFYTKVRLRKVLMVMIILLTLFINKLIPYYQTSIMFLDVGQGDAIYLESKGCRMLIDSYEGSFDFLKNRGIYTLDYLFLTHPDTDHIKEAYEITEAIDVQNIYLSPYGTYPKLNGKIFHAYPEEQMVCGLFLIEILGPIRAYSNDNDNSIVLRITAHEKTFLLTGDIEAEAELDLIRRYELKSDVLKVSHHGSSTSTSTQWIEAVKPQDVILSVGRSNRYGFPSPHVMDRLQNGDRKIYRTDDDRTIIYRFDIIVRKWFVHLPFKPDF